MSKLHTTILTMGISIGLIVAWVSSIISNEGNIINGSLVFFAALFSLSVLFILSLLVSPRGHIHYQSRIFFTVWGASGAIGLTLLTQSMFGLVNESTTLETVAVILAPIVEEISKALPLLVVAVFWKQHINSPLKGFVLGGLSGTGFAFTENIQYYTGSVSTGLWEIFILRGCMSLLLHASATAAIGVFIALSVNQTIVKKTGTIVVGLLLGMSIHGLWNGFAVIMDGWGQKYFDEWLTLYAFLWVPLFIAFITVGMILRNQADKLILHTLDSANSNGIINSLEKEWVMEKRKNLFLKASIIQALTQYEYWSSRYTQNSTQAQQERGQRKALRAVDTASALLCRR